MFISNSDVEVITFIGTAYSYAPAYNPEESAVDAYRAWLQSSPSKVVLDVQSTVSTGETGGLSAMAITVTYR